ncbi:MAG: fibronectin type III domain-containing protein, partial [Ruminococcus sp.]|nr:fibronectin type III domain-containing protein [Ruminococcus sp.]
TKVFKINPKKVTISKAKYKAPKRISLKYKKSATADGYEILYSTSKKFAAKKTTTINTNKLSKTISKLKSGKTYYVKVRAYKTVKGITYYGNFSKTKKVRIK